ncbi:type VI secretion system protein TssA [Alteromonas sp. a30]|uniref:type VI secretion system protein TssA n=1 Tax=Alteromonas sp. a30 TaxID=2730917 RepID=UPI002281ECBC|nr:type VI secretion system protein TssA [Alteromonas sp. a30]MCY7293851.1 type VI secretion system protein TssA [Alteromonas sp. a30]
MNPHHEQLTRLFQEQVGESINNLLKDISKSAPCGADLKLNGAYAAINKARKSDDASTPRGEWKHNLNTANWDEVTQLATESLRDKTKDLQIAIWLMEAQINKYGFEAIAPGVYFLHQLTQKFWGDIHPQMEDPKQDLEYRTNLIDWVNTKLHPTIKQLAITQTRNEQNYSWADWERAAQLEQLPADQKKKLGPDFIPVNTIVTAVIASPVTFYQELFKSLTLAIEALEDYASYFDNLLGSAAPALNGITGLVNGIYETLYNHVKHRMSDASNNGFAEEANVETAPHTSIEHHAGPIRNREEAYARLAEAAEYLSHDDPHSPVPYLVYKAIEWGQLNTAELYQELFVQYQGQLNIFDILGLDISQQAKK